MNLEERLIEFVRENKFFYDNRHPKYKSVVLRDLKFNELSTELNIPVRKLKDRWRTLRDKYYKDLKAINAGNAPLKKWKWMDKLSFLTNGIPKYETVVDIKVAKEEDYTLENDFNMTDEETITIGKPFTDHFILEDDNTLHPCSKRQSQIYKTQLGDVDDLSQKKTIQRILENLSPKTAVDYFYAGLAIQTREAHITGSEFVELQMELLRTFNEFLSTREKSDPIYADLETI